MTQSALPLATPVPAFQDRLHRLLPALTAELEGRAAGTVTARRLRGGAIVALSIDEDHRRTVHLAREDRPKTRAGVRAWGFEVDTFRVYLGIKTWRSIPAEDGSGIAAAFTEVFEGESAPGKSRCPQCGAELPFDLIFGAPDCRRCGVADV